MLTTNLQPAAKRPRFLAHRDVYLAALPNKSAYEKSLMHRDLVFSIDIATSLDLVITTSVDGIVKFWRKSSVAPHLTFIKQFRAHPGHICATSLSADEQVFVTVGQDDQTIKYFDVAGCDMINFVKLGFHVQTAALIHSKGSPKPMLAVSKRNEDGPGEMVIIDPSGMDVSQAMIDSVPKLIISQPATSKYLMV